LRHQSRRGRRGHAVFRMVQALKTPLGGTNSIRPGQIIATLHPWFLPDRDAEPGVVLIRSGQRARLHLIRRASFPPCTSTVGQHRSARSSGQDSLRANRRDHGVIRRACQAAAGEASRWTLHGDATRQPGHLRVSPDEQSTVSLKATVTPTGLRSIPSHGRMQVNRHWFLRHRFRGTVIAEVSRLTGAFECS